MSTLGGMLREPTLGRQTILLDKQARISDTSCHKITPNPSLRARGETRKNAIRTDRQFSLDNRA